MAWSEEAWLCCCLLHTWCLSFWNMQVESDSAAHDLCHYSTLVHMCCSAMLTGSLVCSVIQAQSGFVSLRKQPTLQHGCSQLPVKASP